MSPSMEAATDWASADGSVRLLHGDCLERMAEIPADSIDAVVTDPPYGLEFMGKEWDKLTWNAEGSHKGKERERGANATSHDYGMRICRGINRVIGGRESQAFHHAWAAAALRVLKPGGHLVAFGGTRTHHRHWCALEDAGFEIRDTLMWLYGSGFPKSLDVGKAIDKAAGAEREVMGRSARHGGGIVGAGTSYEVSPDVPVITAPATEAARQWDGWGTALKPAWEPIVLARKPLTGTVAANVQAHGTGALNVDGCRVGTAKDVPASPRRNAHGGKAGGVYGEYQSPPTDTDGWDSQTGRWPANVVLDEEAAAMLDAQSGELSTHPGTLQADTPTGSFGVTRRAGTQLSGGDSGGASRFFFVANWQPSELLLYRAKAILEAWNSGLANTADDSLSLSNEHVVSALSDAVTLASRGEIQLSDCQGLSTSVTPSRLRRLCENAIALTLGIEAKSLPASFPISTGPLSPSHAKPVAQSGQIGTTTITPSPKSSDGSAVVVTLATTLDNTALGARDSPLRFRYCAKASRAERGEGNTHPTVKPLALMRWLVRLVTPPGGLILDPFIGSGTTALAAVAEGFRCVGIDSEGTYLRMMATRATQIAMVGV